MTIQELVERYRSDRVSCLKTTYNETQVRNDFIDPLLKCLGWDVDNNKGKTQFLRDVIQEEYIEVEDETTKKNPDYTLRINGTRKLFVEVKKPSVNILKSAKAAFQTRRYGWNANLGVSILTNFEHLIIYDCRFKPDVSENEKVARVRIFSFEEYVDAFNEIQQLVSFNSANSGQLDDLFSLYERKGQTFDDYFLKQIEDWRQKLAITAIEKNESLYDFSVVDPTILSQIYERFLGSRIVLEEGRQLSILEEPEVSASNGVDINPYATEVSEFSLLLKLLEGENNATVDNFINQHAEKVLPSLKGNIKCGNSLVDSKFFGFMPEALENDQLLHNVKPFDKVINGSNVKPIDHTTEKWTKYFLKEDEINLLRRLKKDKRVITCGDIMEVDVGFVTGRNEFFMMKENQVKEWKLKKYTIPVASKSNQLKGITFSEKDFSDNSKSQNTINLFIPPNEDFKKVPKVCQKYIEHGEQQGFNTGYKTRIRKRWYITPSLWVPDAFALRQVGDYPKLILNETGASSTDTIHRVRFKKGVNRDMAAISFHNSLSFAFSEITGRSYGGGVMTFEPTEIEEIQIPVLADLTIDFDQVDSMIRQRKIEKVLDMVDEALLIKHHGFTKAEVDILRGIWKKLSQRRINRKRK